jgi:glycosyltransferase involved in cell wall biosynthesis
VKVCHVSRTDAGGGAARAATRLHQALIEHSVDSHIVVDIARSAAPRVHGGAGALERTWSRATPRLERALLKAQRSENEILHSAAILPGASLRRIQARQPDIVNLHWVAGGCLSVRQIGRITGPVVWTMHDMWPFCGAEHYAPAGDGARWELGYSEQNRPAGHHGVDLDRWTWQRKRRNWGRRSFNLVTPSRWLADCAQRSALFRTMPVTVIPNALPTGTFRPYDRRAARQELGLPVDSPLILFGAYGGTDSHIKGFDLLQEAAIAVRREQPDARAVLVGTSAANAREPDRLPTHRLGHIADDVLLAKVYSAADVVVVPSRQDNLPQVATEAQACGTPVVAFRTTGLPDTVQHEATGYLAEPFDPADLARGITWALVDPERRQRLEVAARRRAERLWSPATVARQYVQLYASLIDDARRDAPGPSP